MIRRVFSLWGSTVGKKIMMAVTGVILIGFVLVHMLGNLKVYQGAEAFNHYAEGLRTLGEPFFGRGQLLWILRIILLVAVIIHIVAAVQLVLRSRRARAVGYRKYEGDMVFSYASRTMTWGGLIILAFVVYHLLHLTFGTAHPDFIHGNAYHNFVIGFQSWPVSIAYILAMIPLGFHLYHGFWSMLQTFGATNPKLNYIRRPIAAVLAAAIVIANISFPVAVLAGFVGY
ncbi:MAG TPA: succinate dehydrogenase cytochrome b subunit [Longimicrobiales bacterium]|nr:succinate dehydrogenase cytochrome b subunit [Longimicrobiales bacterium]